MRTIHSDEVEPMSFAEKHRPETDGGAGFTPGQFFKEAGILIGVCLGLALFGQLVAMVVGVH